MTELEESQSTQQVFLEPRKADDTSRLQKTTEYYRRVREYQKGDLNDISGWLEVLVCSLKRSEVWKVE